MSKKAQKVQADSGCKGIQGNTSKAELKCVCLNARSIINKKNELDIMVDEIKPHIIGITESWANNDITDAELGLEGYVMFRKDRMGKRGGGVLLYIKETIPAYEVQLHEEADCNEAIWCKLVTGHTTVTIGVVYRCPNITKENNEKIHNAISEVSKGDCIIMGDFNHGNIKWDTLQSTGIEDQKFLCLVQDNFLTQHVLEPTRATRILDIVLSSQKELVDNVEIKEPLGSSDHNQMYFNINVKSDKTKVKQCRRDFRKGNYSSTCHRRPPPVLSKSGPSWQVAPRDRERTLCAIMSNQKHTSDSIHSTAHAQQYKAQHSMTILNAVRHETNTAENV